MNSLHVAWLALFIAATFFLIDKQRTQAEEGSEKPSLSESLKAEPVETLVKDSRAKGDAVRGAILFVQQKLNCIKCHASGGQNLLGPDLTNMDKQVTDAHLIESMLDPSKVIKKGFESVTVTTFAGKTYSGRVVEENAKQLVLRRADDSGKLISFNVGDIEELRPMEISSMPDGLVNELSNRQEFLDLTRYLMELADAGPRDQSKPANEPAVVDALSDELQGLVLLNKYSCTACHAGDSDADSFLSNSAPNLAWGSGRIDPVYIEDFIAAPTKVKPSTAMPDVMHGLETNVKQKAASSITQYIVSLGTKEFEHQKTDSVSAKRGQELFHSVGCVACHSPRNEKREEILSETSVPTGDLRNKYNVTGLVDFLEDPHAARPSGRMPNMLLSHWEATDIANYLLQATRDDETDSPPYKIDRTLIAEGKKQFQQLGCASCHAEPSGISFETSNTRRAPVLADIRPDQGCLSGETGEWPQFQLTDNQRQQMRSALARQSRDLTEHEHLALTLTAFNCLACHQRDGMGGVSSDRDMYFQTTDQNLGQQGRLPPTLTGVGAKLNSKWMREVLVSGRAIRPYVKTRMPQFGADNVGHLVSLFDKLDKPTEIEFAKFKDQKEIKNAGHQLAGNKGLNCIACHTFRQKPTATMSAVDLTEMAERLRKDWFYTYMRDPQRLSPNTVMPSFWPGGRAMRKDVLDGEADVQIEALWQYLLDDRQARPPQGLTNEPMELVATDEAVMLRRSYQGIGKRGIGVGYPGQVNLAFDAEQMRLAMIWKGKFADPAGVWRSQGHGTVRPLGSDLKRFPIGPDLDDASTPWVFDLPEEIAKQEQPNAADIKIRPPLHQFKGYYLDELRRPTFMYRFDGVDVADYPVDIKDDQSDSVMIRRTLTFNSNDGRENCAFRAAVDKNIVREKDGTFLVGDSLKIRIGEPHSAEIIESDAGKQLIIKLDIPKGKTKLVLEYRW